METRKINKVLLVQPPAFANRKRTDINPNVPLGIAYIAAVLEKEGFRVRILDAFVEGWEREEYVNEEMIRVGLSFEEIEKTISDFSPDVVGVSNLFTAQRRNAHKICEVAKKVNRKTTIIMGGAHPTAAPEMVLEDKNVDFVVLGEGENTILEVIKYLEGKIALNTLDGVAFRDNEKISILPKTRFIENLDTIPFPARHLLPMEKYSRIGIAHGGFLERTPYASIVTSRGCPYKCAFCTAYKVFNRKYRYRTTDNVMAEIDMLIRDYGIRELLFEDDNLTLNIKRAEEIFDRLIGRKYDLVWNTPNGVAAFTLNENILKKMKQSGCIQLNLALESGNQWVIDNLIKKPLKLEKIVPLITYARSIGLNVNTFFVVGMPGESLEQIKDTFRFARRMRFYSPHFSVLTPYPGSEVYEICKKNGYLVKDFDFDNLMITKYNIRTPQWTIEELDATLQSEIRMLRLSYYWKNPGRLLKDFMPQFLKNPFSYIKKSIGLFFYVLKRGILG